MLKTLENWNGSAVAVVRDRDGKFGPGAQGLSLEVWNTRKGTVVKAVRRDALGRIEGPTNFGAKIRFA